MMAGADAGPAAALSRAAAIASPIKNQNISLVRMATKLVAAIPCTNMPISAASTPMTSTPANVPRSSRLVRASTKPTHANSHRKSANPTTPTSTSTSRYWLSTENGMLPTPFPWIGWRTNHPFQR